MERARRLAQSAGWLRAEAAVHHMASDYDKAISCLLRNSRCRLRRLPRRP